MLSLSLSLLMLLLLLMNKRRWLISAFQISWGELQVEQDFRENDSSPWCKIALFAFLKLTSLFDYPNPNLFTILTQTCSLFLPKLSLLTILDASLPCLLSLMQACLVHYPWCKHVHYPWCKHTLFTILDASLPCSISLMWACLVHYPNSNLPVCLVTTTYEHL